MDNGELISTRLTLEGAEKCAFLFFRREEVTRGLNFILAEFDGSLLYTCENAEIRVFFFCVAVESEEMCESVIMNIEIDLNDAVFCYECELGFSRYGSDGFVWAFSNHYKAQFKPSACEGRFVGSQDFFFFGYIEFFFFKTRLSFVCIYIYIIKQS